MPINTCKQFSYNTFYIFISLSLLYPINEMSPRFFVTKMFLHIITVSSLYPSIWILAHYEFHLIIHIHLYFQHINDNIIISLKRPHILLKRVHSFTLPGAA